MNELIKVEYKDENPTVSARDLHRFLQVDTRINDWFPRMCEYGFSEGKDFYSNLSESTGGRPSTDYRLSIPMAKEISMIQRNERGKQARQYFLRVEEAWNKPEMVMARALKLAEKTVSAMESQITAMLPKAEYFDEVCDRANLTNLRDTAKAIGVRQRDFVGYLSEHGYIYYDSDSNIRPHARYADAGYFRLIETFNRRTEWAGFQTMVTIKGREHFFQLLRRRMALEAAQ